jgi:hypothetical protein
MSTQNPTHNTADRLVSIIRVIVTVVLGGIGAAAGFTHTHDWAAHHGQTGWLAWADAIVIEGIVVVAGFEVQRDHRTGSGRTVTFPMLVLVAGFGVQMTAQVALAEHTAAGWLVAAMPALGFLVVVKLLMRRTPTTTPAPTPMPAPAHPAPAPMHPAPTPVRPPRETPAPAVSRPAEPPTVTAGSTLAKLPAGVRKTITTATEDAHTAGRAITADDLTSVVSLPAGMLAPLVAELNGSINHHPVTA